MERQKFGYQAGMEQEKLGFEREKHGQTMEFERSKAENDYALKAFGATAKADNDAAKIASQGGEGEGLPQPKQSMQIANPIAQMMQLLQQSMQEQAEMTHALMQQMAESNAQQTQQIIKAVTAPRRAMRDPATGRLSGVEAVMQ